MGNAWGTAYKELNKHLHSPVGSGLNADSFDAQSLRTLEEVIDEHFGGVPKEEIIKVLKEKFPENFI